MIGGGGSNVTVNVGPQGLFVVDTGSAAASVKVVAAIRSISDKPIRYIANTSADVDHIGGNVEVNKLLGQAIRSREVIDERATIVAYETVLNRLTAQTGPQALPSAAWPTSTFGDVAAGPCVQRPGDSAVPSSGRAHAMATPSSSSAVPMSSPPVISSTRLATRSSISRRAGASPARSMRSTGCSTSSSLARRKRVERWSFPGMGDSATRARSWSTATC